MSYFKKRDTHTCQTKPWICNLLNDFSNKTSLCLTNFASKVETASQSCLCRRNEKACAAQRNSHRARPNFALSDYTVDSSDKRE